MENKSQTDGKHFVCLATAISALGGMLFGYDIGVISGAIIFIQKQFLLSSGMEEVVVTLIEHKRYIDKHGQDLPEIRNWKWTKMKAGNQ